MHIGLYEPGNELPRVGITVGGSPDSAKVFKYALTPEANNASGAL